MLPAHARLLGDRYEVVELLASGGMADVYVALDTQLDRQVAVKVLRDVAETDRFQAEARTLARLSHPSLVRVLDVGDVEGRPYLVLELVLGTSLAECCRGMTLPSVRVAEIGSHLAAALAYVHETGWLHRDVKPANILLGDDGRVLLADFGIARLVEGHAEMTQTGQTLGTAAYLAPEQVEGQPLTPAADVYSLGLVLLEALTGERAYPGSPTEAALARLHRPPEIPVTVGSGWGELLSSMTAREPGDRPSTVEVQARLDRLARPSGADDDAGETRALTVPLVLPAPRSLHERLDLRGRVAQLRGLGTVPALAVGAAALMAVVLLVLVLTGGGGSSQPGATPSTPRTVPSGIPRGVPPALVDDLEKLHEAVQGR